jgi:NADPH:quinone reductase-like Zn-dependent oxidoreductase
MKIWGFQTGPYDGAFAQFAKLQARQVRPRPEHLSWTEAAAVSTSLVSVWRMLVTRARVKAGDRVLIWGASGGTGSFAIQLTRALGAVPIAVTSTEKKAEFCAEMGAEHVLIGGKHDIEAEVRRLTDRRGVDVVFDHMGEATWYTGMECLRWGGTMVICGATEGFMPTIDLRYLWNKQLNILGSHIGTHSDWVECLQLVNQKRIHPPVTEVFPLPEVREAQRRMEERELMGKIAILID